MPHGDEAAWTLSQRRRQAWLHSAVAALFVLIALLDLPFDGWTDYLRVAMTVLLAFSAAYSWRAYRRGIAHAHADDSR